MDPQHLPREGYAPVADASLYYRDIGQGPPIIVLHGGPSFDHNYLLPDLDRLADTYRLIYYDQRGRGQSAGNIQPAEVSVQSEMNDLEALREHFQLESVALLGHSWGGLLALEYALRHPERVSRLILLNTAPASYDDCALFVRERDVNAGSDVEILRDLESRPGYAEGDDLDARADYYRVYFRSTLRSPELLDRLIQNLQVGWTKEGIVKAGVVGNRLWQESYESTEYNLLPALTQVRIPTLILHGDYDFVPVACATHIAEAVPGARLVVLRDCGHFSYIERPDEVRSTLDEFF
jgi:proline iminopeptidase